MGFIQERASIKKKLREWLGPYASSDLMCGEGDRQGFVNSVFGMLGEVGGCFELVYRRAYDIGFADGQKQRKGKPPKRKK